MVSADYEHSRVVLPKGRGETSGTKKAPEEKKKARVPEQLTFLVEGTRELDRTPAHTKEARHMIKIQRGINSFSDDAHKPYPLFYSALLNRRQQQALKSNMNGRDARTLRWSYLVSSRFL